MGNTVQIEDKLYNDIKEYCKLNKLKIGSFINEILKKNFLIEKYGDTPFTNFSEKMVENIEPIPEPIQDVIDNHFYEILDDNKEIKVPDELKQEFVKNIEKELIQPEPINTVEDVVKTNEPIVNKPKKRRLK